MRGPGVMVVADERLVRLCHPGGTRTGYDRRVARARARTAFATEE